MLLYAIGKSACGKVSVSHYEGRELVQFFPVTSDDTDVMLYHAFASKAQFLGIWSLMCPQHDAVMDVYVYQANAHDFESVFHRPCASRPEFADMRSLLSRLADVAGIDGDGLSSCLAKVSVRKCRVEFKPVYALRLFKPEVIAVGLLVMRAIPLHLCEIYLSLYYHVQ